MQFAILISVLVALLLGAFLLLTHVQSFFRIKSQELVQAFETSNATLLKSLDAVAPSKDTIVTELGATTTKINASYNGAWVRQYSSVTSHNRKVERTALSGSKHSDKTPNLYLANTNSPLVVVGNTRLEGNSYLPKQGIKAGNISGTYYQGNNLYYGRVIESNETLPQLDQDWITYLENVFNGALQEEIVSVSLTKELKNSFRKPTKLVLSFDPVFLVDEKITGNIIIQSRSKIVVGPGTQLTDVTLVAPQIIIKNGVKGSFQSLATKSIKIGKECYLSYPSSAVLLDKNRVVENAQNVPNTNSDFSIDSSTVIEGAVVYLKNKENDENRIKTHISIAPRTEVVGEVYCQGNVDFQGIIRGSLYTQQCIAKQFGSVYLNHIYNGRVLVNPVSDYAGLPFVNSKKSIAKWLY